MPVAIITQFYMISVKHRSTLNVTIWVILITKYLQGCNEPWFCPFAPQCSFHSNNLTIKNFQVSLVIIIMNREIQTVLWFWNYPQTWNFFLINSASLRITVIQKMWYKVNTVTLMNCNNWKFPIKKRFFLLLTAISKYSVWCNCHNWNPKT